MRWTLSSKVILSVSGILLALSIVVAALTFVEMRRVALAEQEDFADVLNYTFEILLGQEALPSLQRVTENSATVKEVRRIVIVDRDMKVLASSNPMEVGRQNDSTFLRELMAEGRFERIRRATEDELILLQPLRGGRSMGGATGDIAGALQITLALDVIEGAARAAALRLLAISLGSYVVLSVVLGLVLRVMVTGPVQKLATAAQRFREGDRSLRSGLRRGDEIGVLSVTFDDMANEVDAILQGLEGQVASRTKDIEEQRAALAVALDELKTSTAELQTSTAELQTSTAARLALAETVKQLSTPVIKIHERVVLMPLVGTIDTERAALIERSLLEGIEAHGAEAVLLDLTGVAIVDAAVAAGLLRAARAAQLLGASVTLVGITGRVAQSIVRLEVDLSGISTRGDLQGGLTHALRELGLGVARSGGHR